MTVIMDVTSEKMSQGTAAVQTRILAEENSRIRLVQIQRLGEDFLYLNDIGGVCGEGAGIEIIQVVLGGRDTYQGCRIELAGDESRLDTDLGYLLGAEQHLDMNYEALHRGKNTESRIDVSGVLKDKARKLFRGTVDFRRGSAGAVGQVKEEVLLLEDTVVNQTIPLILCEEEDVRGGHGATIGDLSEEVMHYMESRGICREAVYKLMARARVDAVCSKIPDERARNTIQEYLEEGGSHDRE